MKKILTLLFCLFALPTNAIANTPGEINIGAYLPDTSLNKLDDRTLKTRQTKNSSKFSDFRGKPLLINVWASWCEPCRSEIGSLDRLSRRFGGKQFNVIGVSTDDDANAALAFTKQSKLSFKNYIDHNLVLENMLGANTIPLTVLVDANGKIVQKIRGFQEWDSPESLLLIEKTLNVKLNNPNIRPTTSK